MSAASAERRADRGGQAGRVLDALPLGIVVTDRRGTIRRLNAQAADMVRQAGWAAPPPRIQDLLGGAGEADRFPLPEEGLPDRPIRVGGRLWEAWVSPLPSTGNRGGGGVYALRDVSERERRRTLERQGEVSAALGHWTARMAHDLRNPLGSIELFASLLRKDLKRRKDLQRIDQIIAAAETVANRISELMMAGTSDRIPEEPVDLHGVLADILLFSERIIDRESVYLTVRYAAVRPVIACNTELIRQVLLNLILKALQTLPEPDRLEIATRYRPEARTIEIHFLHPGAGGQEERLPIFGAPGERGGRGAALDLAIVHNIVNLYRGTIRIESREGVGRAFIISFPVLSVGPDPAATTAGRSPQAR